MDYTLKRCFKYVKIYMIITKILVTIVYDKLKKILSLSSTLSPIITGTIVLEIRKSIIILLLTVNYIKINKGT